MEIEHRAVKRPWEGKKKKKRPAWQFPHRETTREEKFIYGRAELPETKFAYLKISVAPD